MLYRLELVNVKNLSALKLTFSRLILWNGCNL